MAAAPTDKSILSNTIFTTGLQRENNRHRDRSSVWRLLFFWQPKLFRRYVFLWPEQGKSVRPSDRGSFGERPPRCRHGGHTITTTITKPSVSSLPRRSSELAVLLSSGKLQPWYMCNMHTEERYLQSLPKKEQWIRQGGADGKAVPLDIQQNWTEVNHWDYRVYARKTRSSGVSGASTYIRFKHWIFLTLIIWLFSGKENCFHCFSTGVVASPRHVY